MTRRTAVEITALLLVWVALLAVAEFAPHDVALPVMLGAVVVLTVVVSRLIK